MMRLRLETSSGPALAVALLIGHGACGSRSQLGVSGASGGGATASTSVASSSSTASGCADAVLGRDALGAVQLALDGADAYWTTVDGKLMKSASGAPGVALAEGLSYPSGVAVQGDLVVFTDVSRVLSMPKSGGATSTVAEAQSLPMVVAADPGAIYWLNRGDGILAGSVMRSVAGGAPEVLHDKIDTASDMVIDDAYVYVAAALADVNGGLVTGPLFRVARADGKADVLAQDLHEPAGLAVDATHVYWLEQVDASFSYPGRLRSRAKSAGALPVDVASTGDVLALAVTVDASFAYVTGLQGIGAASRGVLLRAPLSGGALTEVTHTPTTLYGAVKNDTEAIFWGIAWSTGLGPVPPGSPSLRKLCK